MTAPHDADRLIRTYLEDGPIQLADRSFDAVRESIERTHQRTVIGPWRTPAVNTYAKLATAAAAVVLVAVLGVSLIPGVGPVGGPGPTPTPTPTPAPTPAPTPPAPPLGDGSLDPGRYAWEWPGGRVTFEVAEGWTGGERDKVARNIDAPTYLEILPWFPGTASGVNQVYSDACAPGEDLVPIDLTTADLVAALQAQGGMDATVTELEIGGLPATRVDLAVEPGLDTDTCRYAPDGPIQVWFLNDEAGYLALAPATDGTYGKAVIWSVDVEGGPLVLTSFSNIDTAPADVAAIEAIVASMAFE